VKNEIDRDIIPKTNTTRMAAAGIFLAVPIVALLWVGTYAKPEPALLGFPFFIWYQFLWVFLCSFCTWMAYRQIAAARPRRPQPANRRETQKGRR
jgi:membrane protein implicated in regulation of membrane protease activity